MFWYLMQIRYLLLQESRQIEKESSFIVASAKISVSRSRKQRAPGCSGSSTDCWVHFTTVAKEVSLSENTRGRIFQKEAQQVQKNMREYSQIVKWRFGWVMKMCACLAKKLEPYLNSPSYSLCQWAQDTWAIVLALLPTVQTLAWPVIPRVLLVLRSKEDGRDNYQLEVQVLIQKAKAMLVIYIFL